MTFNPNTVGIIAGNILNILQSIRVQANNWKAYTYSMTINADSECMFAKWFYLNLTLFRSNIHYIYFGSKVPGVACNWNANKFNFWAKRSHNDAHDATQKYVYLNGLCFFHVDCQNQINVYVDIWHTKRNGFYWRGLSVIVVDRMKNMTMTSGTLMVNVSSAISL